MPLCLLQCLLRTAGIYYSKMHKSNNNYLSIADYGTFQIEIKLMLVINKNTLQSILFNYNFLTKDVLFNVTAYERF